MLTPRWRTALVDAACVLVFAAVGRSSHAEQTTVLGLLTTAWPFLVGLVLATVLAGVLADRWPRSGDRRDPLAILPWAWTVPVVTWAVAMGLRVVSGQGVSGAFPLVALGFLVLALLGWRAVAGAVRGAVSRRGLRRSSERAPGTPGRGG
ncbi:DUF3054 domain-containing protein [Sanguibacter sp. 25GB23B1]|uniref:DUF3054 domain-containing protein n=1 Tax=unclassified Sanguibacter TaxID=2645534 RepID=UPI0032AF1396